MPINLYNLKVSGATLQPGDITERYGRILHIARNHLGSMVMTVEPLDNPGAKETKSVAPEAMVEIIRPLAVPEPGWPG